MKQQRARRYLLVQLPRMLATNNDKKPFAEWDNNISPRGYYHTEHTAERDNDNAP